MTTTFVVLGVTAVSIGFIHTLCGPDHYIPFITIAKARKWSYRRTMIVTLLCGLGHVASSVVLGLIGVMAGVTLERLTFLESIRGDWAAWALISFGLVYFIYGVRRAYHAKPHRHDHEAVAHAPFRWTLWALFIIFVLGPCEPLIPLLMYPAIQDSIREMIAVTALFSISTIGTMMVVVTIATCGINVFPIKKYERFTHAFAGSAIILCGCAIVFLGV